MCAAQRRRKRSEENQRLLNHRVKNTLTTVQSIASQTLRNAPTTQEAREALEGRLLALSGAHVSGPEVRLPPRMALALAMVLQELATNAVKYGALSNPTGEIRLTWRVEGKAPARIHLRSEESGGPPVQAPSRRGFGTRLIERSLAQDLDGDVRIEFAPSGVTCTVDAPIV